MAAIFQMTFSNAFFNENIRISINVSLNFVPYGLLNYKSVLVQIMTWRRAGEKPLSEPMMSCFAVACVRLSASMS